MYFGELMLPFFALLFALFFLHKYNSRMFTNREEFLQYIITSNLKFNKYDYRFLNNLSLLIVKNKHVSTNQNALFEKLVNKYKKQLKYAGILIENILILNWTVEIVESTSEFTEAFLSLRDNRLELKLPFSKKFIDVFHDTEKFTYKFTTDKKLVWNTIHKCYQGEFNTYNLRFVNEVVPKFFKLNYCPALTKIVNQLNRYENKYYDPTYVKIKNKFYVLASNNILDKAIENITFDDSPATLLQLSQYGIQIHESVSQQDDFLLFAGSVQNQIDTVNVDILVDYLKRLSVRSIILNVRLTKNPIYKPTVDVLTENFEVYYYKYFANEIQNFTKPAVLIKGVHLSGIDATKLQVQKIITLVSSTAIKL